MSARVEYKINDTTKWSLLILALFFDFIQFLTPGYTDAFVTFTAFLVLGMIFIEKGSLRLPSKGAMKLFRIIVPISEILMSMIPGITLLVWIQIKISRLLDESSSETIEEINPEYGKGNRGQRTAKRLSK